MGRFSKLLIQNIILELQEGYIYYKSIKKAVLKQKAKKDSSTNISFNILASQLHNTTAFFQSYSPPLAQKISELSQERSQGHIKVLQQLANSLIHLISFSLWNIKIVNRCLTRIETLVTGSKKLFISENLDYLNSLQNLVKFKEMLSELNKNFFYFRRRNSNNLEIRTPLLSKPDSRELLILSNLLDKAKQEITKLENEELFPKEPDYPDFMSLLLTTISSFIQLTNIYMLSLAAKDYSLYVGMDETFSGILSATNWTAAVLFTFLYSYLTNFRFKSPMLICSFCMITGNLIYFLAYFYESVWMLIIGRVLIGIGSARMINRRYITTFVSVKARTSWNSFFVAGAIIGRGLGPIIAGVLYFAEYKVYGFSINGLNSPALIMMFVWVLYGGLVICCFKETKIQELSEQNLQVSKKKSFLPAWVVIFTLAVPRLIHEAYLTSIPIVTSKELEWPMDFIGVYIAAVSLAVAPVHIFIAFTSNLFEDRQFIRFSLIMTFIGTLLLINLDELSEVQYIFGTLIMYLGVNMNDSVTSSLLSKVMPPHISVGIFNTGLIVTLSGSLARGIGGGLIAVSGMLDSETENMQNLLFVPLSFLAFAVLAVSYMFYILLQPLDQKNAENSKT